MSRQKILLAFVGVLLAAQVGDWLISRAIKGPMQIRRARTLQLQKVLKQRKQAYERLRQELAILSQWEAQSLPRNPDVARSLYRSWLLDLVAKVKFSNRHVEAGSPVNHRGLYQSIAFSVRGRGTLEQVLQFLYEFYSANHLHQIRALSLVPVPGTTSLDVVVSIEALILPTTDRVDRLAEGRANRLAWKWPDDYQVILEKNFFGFRTTRGIHPADLAVLTAVLEANGQPEAWITLRNADKVLKLHSGDTLSAGPITARVVEILDRDVVLEIEGQRWLLSIGDRLSDATALPPEF